MSAPDTSYLESMLHPEYFEEKIGSDTDSESGESTDSAVEVSDDEDASSAQCSSAQSSSDEYEAVYPPEPPVVEPAAVVDSPPRPSSSRGNKENRSLPPTGSIRRAKRARPEDEAGVEAGPSTAAYSQEPAPKRRRVLGPGTRSQRGRSGTTKTGGASSSKGKGAARSGTQARGGSPKEADDSSPAKARGRKDTGIAHLKVAHSDAFLVVDRDEEDTEAILHRHISEKHWGFTSSKCPECDKVYSRLDAMKRHFYKKHPGSDSLSVLEEPDA
ncbi:hypothetical protein C8Q77DRAFT_1254120 [Trametes polyzona]|nr:hypothetical protein C8Q77DRAFT_1254120 [Trametes polyzona]